MPRRPSADRRPKKLSSAVRPVRRRRPLCKASVSASASVSGAVLVAVAAAAKECRPATAITTDNLAPPAGVCQWLLRSRESGIVLSDYRSFLTAHARHLLHDN